MKGALQSFVLTNWASVSSTFLGYLGKCLEEVSPGDCAIKAYVRSPGPASCSAVCQSRKEWSLRSSHCYDGDLHHCRPSISRDKQLPAQSSETMDQNESNFSLRYCDQPCRSNSYSQRRVTVWSHFPLLEKKEQRST